MLESNANIVVCGLGYIGLVTSLSLTKRGHAVYSYDSNQTTLSNLKNGIMSFDSDDINKLFSIEHHKLRFELPKAASDTIWCVCVGTPINKDGSLDISQIHSALQFILSVIKKDSCQHIVVIRSSVPMGTCSNLIKLAQSELDKNEFARFSLCHVPEFLREGQAIEDYENPPIQVIGSTEKKISEVIAPLFFKDSNFNVVNYEEAELIKLSSNAFHALKISFANEIKRLSEPYGIDLNNWHNSFCSDSKLNISKAYLKPGFAYGGPCLNKDLSGLKNEARKYNINLPVIESISFSNMKHIEFYASKISDEIDKNHIKNIMFSGISFKKNTSDIRGSAVLDLISYILDRHPETSLKIICNEKEKLQLNSTRFEKFVFTKTPGYTTDLLVLGINSDQQIIKQVTQKNTKIIDLNIQ